MPNNTSDDTHSYYTRAVLGAFTRRGTPTREYTVSSTDDATEYLNTTFDEFKTTRDLDFSNVDIPGHVPTDPDNLPIVANPPLPVPYRTTSRAIRSTQHSRTSIEPFIHDTEYVNEPRELPDLSDLPERVTVRTDVLIGLLLAYINDHRFDPSTLPYQDSSLRVPGQVQDTPDPLPQDTDTTDTDPLTDVDRDLDFDDVDIPGATDPSPDPEPEPDPSPHTGDEATATASSAHETWGTTDDGVTQASTPPRPDVDSATDDESFDSDTHDTPDETVQTTTDTDTTPSTDTTSASASTDTTTEETATYGHDRADLGDIDDIRHQSVYDDLETNPSHTDTQTVRAPGTRLVGALLSLLGIGRSLGVGIGRLAVFLLQKTVFVIEAIAAVIMLLFAVDAVIILTFPTSTFPVQITSYVGRIQYLTGMAGKIGIVIITLTLIAALLDTITGNGRYDGKPSPDRL